MYIDCEATQAQLINSTVSCLVFEAKVLICFQRPSYAEIADQVDRLAWVRGQRRPAHPPQACRELSPSPPPLFLGAIRQAWNAI